MVKGKGGLKLEATFSLTKITSILDRFQALFQDGCPFVPLAPPHPPTHTAQIVPHVYNHHHHSFTTHGNRGTIAATNTATNVPSCIQKENSYHFASCFQYRHRSLAQAPSVFVGPGGNIVFDLLRVVHALPFYARGRRMCCLQRQQQRRQQSFESV